MLIVDQLLYEFNIQDKPWMSREPTKYFFLLLALLLSAKCTLASTTDTIRIREVEITHALPINLDAFISTSSDTISMGIMSGRNLSELLVLQPALFIKSAGRGSLSTASFRGTDASHTKVFWNGIKLNSPMLGQVDFSQVPVWVIDDLSLLYGGSSMQEGSGALGGAIVLENSVDWNQPLSVSLNQEIGSFSTFGTYGKLGLGDDNIRSVTRMYRNSSRNDYPFINKDIIPNEEQVLTNGAYKKAGMLQEIYLRPGQRQELSLRLWYQESERELPPMMSQEGAARDEKQEDRNLRSSVEWKMYPGFGSIKVRSGYSGADMKYHLYHEDFDYLQFDSRSRENSLYNTVQTDIQANRSRFQLRADFNRHDAGIKDLVRDEGYSHARNETGLLGSVHRRTGERWILYALLRQEWAEGNRLPLMPSAGFRYRIFDDKIKSTELEESLYLKGSLSKNYNLPSLNDLYWIPGGNPDLRPENSLNTDLSLEFIKKGERLAIQGTLNGYAARVVDWILWKPTQYRYWEPENLAVVFSRGMDIQLGSDVFLGDWMMNIKASYAFTRSTNEGDSRQLIYIPVHSANAYLNVTSRGYYFNWSANYTGSRNTQPGNGNPVFAGELDPYLLQDLHLGKSWRFGRFGGGLRLTVYNLFNVTYQAIRSRPMPMRNYALTLRLEI